MTTAQRARCWRWWQRAYVACLVCLAVAVAATCALAMAVMLAPAQALHALEDANVPPVVNVAPVGKRWVRGYVRADGRAVAGYWRRVLNERRPPTVEFGAGRD